MPQEKSTEAFWELKMEVKAAEKILDWVNTVVNITLALIVLFLILFAYDYGNRQSRSDITAQIIYRGFAAPVPANDSIYMLVLKRGSTIFSTRVPKEHFYSVKKNDRLLLTRSVGAITGYEYDIQLRTVTEKTYPMYRATNLKTTK